MTLIEKRRQKPFRVFAGSPSWLHEDQMVTPREWHPRPLTCEEIVARTEYRREVIVTGWTLIKVFTGMVLAALVGWWYVRAWLAQ
jgi:hypothetical protein